MAVGDWLPYLKGTIKNTFKIGKATIDGSSVTTEKSYTLPDTAGTIALTTSTVSSASALSGWTLYDVQAFSAAN